MTKRISCLFIGLLLIFSLAGCGSSTEQTITSQTETTESMTPTSQITDTNDADTQKEIENDTPQEQTDTAGSNVLVVYFSRTGEQYEVGVIDKGNTAIVADMIIGATGADSFEILPADVEYPTAYRELTDYAKQEQNENARPAIAGEMPDLSQYDTIFIGAPVWWGDWPIICYTYFEANDFSGKTLYPFSTLAGSGLSGFDRSLANAAPGATVGTGLAVRGKDCQNNQDSVQASVNDWLSGIGY